MAKTSWNGCSKLNPKIVKSKGRWKSSSALKSHAVRNETKSQFVFTLQTKRIWYPFNLLYSDFRCPANSSARDLSGPDSSDAQGRNKLPSFWWERAAAIRRMALKAGTDFPQLSLRPSQAANQLDHLRAEGITALEVFAPMEGGGSFDGLDSKNLFRIDPELGTMQDFRRLIRLAHSKRIAVIAALNLGYASVEAPFFLKASDDMKKGKRSQEASWFLWSDGPDAPPPGTNNRYFMVRPNL